MYGSLRPQFKKYTKKIKKTNSQPKPSESPISYPALISGTSVNFQHVQKEVLML